MNNIETELQSRVRALGANFNPEVLAATQNIYRPHLDMTPVREQADVVYGDHERHRLDLYLPEGKTLGVVVFIYGGGFISGDKNQDGTFYVNVGRFLARQGFAAVLPNYRRAPECGWPSAAHDVRDAIAWVRLNVAGVPLFVLGQSAGASHVASWLFDDQSRGTPLGDVAGVMLMSGYYKATAPLPANIQAYFGADATLYEARSPFTHIKPTPVPLWLSAAEFDPGAIVARTFELAQALSTCHGKSPEFAWLRGHNHVSTVMSLGSPQTDVAEEILRFLRAGAQHASASSQAA